MELRSKEHDPEEHRQNADALSSGLHVITKTKLRPDWLQGQVRLGKGFQLGTGVEEARRRNMLARFLA